MKISVIIEVRLGENFSFRFCLGLDDPIRTNNLFSSVSFHSFPSLHLMWGFLREETFNERTFKFQ